MQGVAGDGGRMLLQAGAMRFAFRPAYGCHSPFYNPVHQTTPSKVLIRVIQETLP